MHINRTKNMRSILESINLSESSCGCGPDCKCGGSCAGKCGDENCPCECGARTGVGINECSISISESFELTEDGNDASFRLQEISEEIQELAREALHIVQQNGGHYERARRYWYGHIMSAAGSDEYPGGPGDSSIIDSAKEVKQSGSGYERAAQEMVEYMEENPDAHSGEMLLKIAHRHNVDSKELEEYMDEEGYSW